MAIFANQKRDNKSEEKEFSAPGQIVNKTDQSQGL